MTPEDRDVLKLLHTADWHLGATFRQFDDAAAQALSRARLEAVERLLGLAEQYDVHAVLCAGDLFDGPAPPRLWWEGLAKLLGRLCRTWARPVVLLPGNHDPLTPTSVWWPTHPFRADLPRCVRVVDTDDFTLPLGPDAVLHALPCRSQAGERDLALALPARAPGDARIRIGLVHGSTFDMKGFETNFPIARDAAARRGFDYLAIGDTHGFREVPEGAAAPTVYPGAPEPTRFGEQGAGGLAFVTFRRHGERPTVRREQVGRWTWREATVRALVDLRALRDEDLKRTVLRLTLDLEVSLPEQVELERLLVELGGSDAANGLAGVLVVDRRRVDLRPDVTAFPPDLPEALRAAVQRLQGEAAGDGPERDMARRALIHLHTLVRQGGLT